MKRPPFGPILFATAALIIGILLWIVRTNGGKFVYTLDDPYIHLALARRIGQGHYGINLGENSSPSSSILWPFLLAPFAGLAGAEYLPLLLCSAFSLVAVGWSVREFGSRFNPWLVAAVVVVLTNQIGLVFTGMEHSLQVLLAIVAGIGLLREREAGAVSPWLTGALMLGPLIRYENLAITLPSAVYLWFRGHRRVALASAVVPLGGIVLASLGFKMLGLGMLPSSVVAKSGAGTAGNPILDLLNNFKRNLTMRETLLECYSFLLILAAVCYGALKTKGGDRQLALAAAAAGGIHMFLGRFGWAGRYEPYIVAFEGILLVGLWPRIPFGASEGSSGLGRLAANLLAVALLPLAAYYVFLRGLRAPGESHDIYLQQYQMHRFVTENWQKPVAVNDLGWVSWENDRYVLDLWGLGSYEALKLRASETGTEWMARLCDEHHVEAAMVYDDWFHGAPKGWIKVATLSRFQGKPRPRDDVSIYATNVAAADELSRRLQDFEMGLPPGASLRLTYRWVTPRIQAKGPPPAFGTVPSK